MTFLDLEWYWRLLIVVLVIIAIPFNPYRDFERTRR